MKNSNLKYDIAYWGMWCIILVFFFILFTLSSCKKYEMDNEREWQSAKKRLVGYYNNYWEFKNSGELWTYGGYSGTDWELNWTKKKILFKRGGQLHNELTILKLSNDTLIFNDLVNVGNVLIIKQ